MGAMNNAAFDAIGFYADVGERLRRYRRQQSKTQAVVSSEIGIPRATYANLECGRQRVTVDVLWRAAIVLNVPFIKLTPEWQRPHSHTGDAP